MKKNDFQKKILTSFMTTTLISSMAWSRDQLIPQFDQDLLKSKITLQMSSESFENLVAKLREEIRSQTETQNHPLKKKALQNLQVWVEKNLQSRTSTLDRESLYLELKAVLYALQSNLIEDTETFKDTLKKVGRIIKGQILLPYVAPSQQNQVLNHRNAAKEAFPLVDLTTGRSYLNPQDLEGLSHSQVSQLEVTPNHPMWYQPQELERIKTENGSAWRFLEKKIEKEISQALNADYRLENARKILIIDAIKSSATSPKVDAKDLFGLAWKIKWGEEIHSEPIANRLSVELGAKFADPVYANSSNPSELILLLGSPNSSTPSPILSLEDFKKALLESKYEFDLTPYIASSGIVTESNFAQIFGNQNIGTKQKENILGRTYVTFNESSVEFQGRPDFLHRIGALALSSQHAQQDRVKRALVLFSYWIQNKDAKDDNTKSVLLGGQNYYEYIHDFGASLAGIRTSASPNGLENSFLEVLDHGLSIHIQHPVLYKPKAFTSATMADQLWMARKITALRVDEIRTAIDSSRWPQFQKDVLLSKLITRRNQIAQVYNVGEVISITGSSEEKRSLLTTEDRRQVVKEFEIANAFGGDEQQALEHLESLITLAGGTFSEGQSSIKTDVIAKTKHGIGKVSSCENSVIIAALESSVRPTGLSRRVQRASDDKPLRLCYPGFQKR